MIMCVLLCYPVSIRIYYQQGGLFLVGDVFVYLQVTFIGDGTSNPVHVSGDKLSNKDELIKIGTELSLPSHISQTRNKLGDRIFE